MQGRRSFWTWGFERDEPSDEDRRKFAASWSKRLGKPVEVPPIPALADITLRAPRIAIPSALQAWVTADKYERVVHTHGGHSLELLQAMRGDFASPPDAVAHPRTEAELEATLAWCDKNGYTVIPSGGRTSVVWGVNVPESCDAAVTIDMDKLDRVLEIDDTSRAARIQAGIYGPDLENALRPRGYTLRHFPQSFPWSTLGGWIATRSGGHYATNHTHIDDFVESTRMLTPAGWWESRRLPGSGAGPSPDRIVLGSEGTLGIITEAWMRIQKRPVFRATAGVDVRFVAGRFRSGAARRAGEAMARESSAARSGGSATRRGNGRQEHAADHRLRVGGRTARCVHSSGGTDRARRRRQDRRFGNSHLRRFW